MTIRVYQIIIWCVCLCNLAYDAIGTDANLMAVSDCTIDDLRHLNDSFRNGATTTIADPSTATKYFFNNCDITIVPDAFFANVPHVTSLHFHDSHIHAISPNAFDGLDDLEAISVTRNANLTRLQLWSAQTLKKVTHIDLNANQIDRFDLMALNAYPNLTELNLSDNQLTHIPIGVFDVSVNLVVLNLENNRIYRLDSGIFKSLLRLEVLNLASNRIKYLDAFTFTALAHLKTLRLERNAIAALPELVFFNLDRLVYLSLSGNLLQTIGDRTFQQNTHLSHLDISYNRLKQISSHALASLESLQVGLISSRLIVHCNWLWSLCFVYAFRY